MRGFAPTGLTRRLFLVALALIVIPALAVFVATLAASRANLAPEISRKGEAVGRSLVVQMERAVGYGIPLDRLAGMGEFLQGAIAENPDILYLAVVDPAGRTLHSARNAHYDGRLITQPAAWRNPDVPLIELPVRSAGRTIGQLVIAQDPDMLLRIYLAAQRNLAIALVIGLFLAVEVIVYLTGRTVLEPLRQADRLMAQAAAGDFTRTAADPGDDEIGHFLGAYNRLIHTLNRRFEDLAVYAEDVRAAMLDPEAAKQAAAAGARALAGRRFGTGAAGETLARTDRPLGRTVTFLVAASLSLTLSPALDLLASADGVRRFAGLAAAAIAAAAFGGRLLDRPLRGLGVRGGVIAGGLLAMAPLAAARLPLPAGAAAMPVTAAAMIAAAVGLSILILKCTDGVALPVLPGRADGGTSPWPPLAHGVLCGVGAMVLLRTAGAIDMQPALAAAIAVGAALLALAGLPAHRPVRPPPLWPDGGEIAGLAGCRAVMLAGALMVLPASALAAGFAAVALPMIAHRAGWPVEVLEYAAMAFTGGIALGHAAGGRFARSQTPLLPAIATLALAGFAALALPTEAAWQFLAGTLVLGLLTGLGVPARDRAVLRLVAADAERFGERRVALFLRLGTGLAAVGGALLAGFGRFDPLLLLGSLPVAGSALAIAVFGLTTARLSAHARPR